MTQATTSVKTTVILEYTEAPIIRCCANRDMPEYDILEGSIFYLARSESESLATGKSVYHVIRWDYWKIEFRCPCKAVVTCKHQKAVNADCARQHSLQGYKPAVAEKYDAVAEAEAFVARIKSEKAATEAIAQAAEKVAKMAQGKATGKVVESVARGSLQRKDFSLL